MDAPNNAHEDPTKQSTRDISDYLQSPVETILASLEDESQECVSTHDVLQAYGLCAARLKTVSDVLRDGGQQAAAVAYLQNNASKVAKCLARDIGRAMNEFPGDDEQELGHGDARMAMTDEDLQDARESAALAQHALALVAQISSQPALKVLRSDDDVMPVLDALVSILAAPALSTPGQEKTKTLALWALSHICMSSACLEGREAALVRILTSIFEHERSELMIADGLRVLRNIFFTSPAATVPIALDLMQYALKYLVGPNVHLRNCAAHTLLGYAHALVLHDSAESQDGLPLRDIIRTRIIEFVDSQVRLHRQTSKGNAVDEETLPSLIYSQIPQHGTSEPGPHVGWAFTVLGVLVALSDGMIFSRKTKSLRFIFDSIAPYYKHDNQNLKRLHAFVRRAFVWAFGRFQFLESGEESNSSVSSTLRNGLSRREAMFQTLKQLMPGDEVGSTLVYTLLGSSPPLVPPCCPDEDDVARAITVIDELVSSVAKDRFKHLEGVKLLSMLTRELSEDALQENRASWDLRTVLPQSLFGGTWLEVDGIDNLDVPQEKFSGHVRPLSDAEIVRHWDQLLSIWRISLYSEAMHYNRRVPQPRVLGIWKDLLRARSRITSDRGVLHLVSVLCTELIAVLSWTPSLRSSRPFTRNVLVIRLTFLRDLWAQAKVILSLGDLRDASGPILNALIRANTSLDEPEVKELWTTVCTELCVCGGSGVLITHKSDPDFKVKTKAWAVIAESWVKSQTSLPWNAVTALLAVPFEGWRMDEAETDLWVDLCEVAFEISRKINLRPSIVMEEICGHVTNHSGQFTPKIVLSLVNRLHVDEDDDSFPIHFFTHLNAFLEYPASNFNLYHCIDIIQTLSTYIPKWPGRHVVALLVYVHNLSCWVRDRAHFVNETNFQTSITPFYCNALQSLVQHATKPPMELLLSLEKFLTSPFESLSAALEESHPQPSPRIELLLHAFKAYMDAIKDHLSTLNSPLPPGIQRSSTIYYYIFRSERPNFFTDDSLSSSQQTTSSISDSHPNDAQDNEAAAKIGKHVRNHDEQREALSTTPRATARGKPGAARRPPSIAGLSVEPRTPRPSARQASARQAELESPEIPFLELEPPASLHLEDSADLHTPLRVSALQNATESPILDSDSVHGGLLTRKRRGEELEEGTHKRRKSQPSKKGGSVVMSSDSRKEGLPTVESSSRAEPDDADPRRREIVAEREVEPTSSAAMSSAEKSLPSPPSTADRGQLRRVDSDKENAPVEADADAMDDDAADDAEDMDDVGVRRRGREQTRVSGSASSVVSAIRRAREQLRDDSDMSLEELLAVKTMIDQMGGTVDERLRACFSSKSPEV